MEADSMKNKKNIFNDKRFKYGTYSTVVTIVFIAILVVFNLVVGQFNRSFDFIKYFQKY